MYQNTSSNFAVPLSFDAHALAEKLSRRQSKPQKAKQVYLNTLAVWAVDFYLRCLGIETEVEKSDSRNSIYLEFIDVADLWVKSIGRLECRPILPESSVMEIPLEAREDRVGYVAVRLDRSLKQATLLGFTPNTVAELPLSQLDSLDEFLEFLSRVRPISPMPIDLTQWLHDCIEEGWQKLETLFSLEQQIPAFRTRSTLVERGKLIHLATQVKEETIVLVVKVDPQSENDINIIVEVRPASGRVYLPEALKAIVLDERRKAVMEAIASGTNRNIQFDFNVLSGERFSIQMILGVTSATEEFIV